MIKNSKRKRGLKMCEKWRDRVRKRERGLNEERVRV